MKRLWFLEWRVRGEEKEWHPCLPTDFTPQSGEELLARAAAWNHSPGIPLEKSHIEHRAVAWVREGDASAREKIGDLRKALHDLLVALRSAKTDTDSFYAEYARRIREAMRKEKG